ncbi:hypothetical protein ACTM71_02390 [Citrobacter portucalensis]
MEKKTILNSTFISAYLLFSSASYLWGFWGHFEVNIFNYIGVSDIIKSVIWPMAITLVMYLIQVAMNVYNSPKPNSTLKLSGLSGEQKAKNILSHSYLLIMLLIVVGAVVYTLATGNKMQRYAAVGWIIAVIVFCATMKNSELMDYIPFKNKTLTYSIIIFMPVLFLTRGVSEGERILSGKDTFIIESKSLCPGTENSKYRYIDVISDKAFALSLKDNSICIFKYDYLKLTKERSPTNK